MQTLFILVAMIVFAIGAATRADAQQPAAAAQKGAETECLAKPKGVPPAGQRWAYYTDRTIKRRCWFLAEGAKETGRSASAKRAERRVTNARTAKPQPRRVVAADPEIDAFGADQAEQSAALTPALPGAQKPALDSAWSAQPPSAQRQATPETEPFLAESIESIRAELPVAADDRVSEARLADPAATAEPPAVESSVTAAKHAPTPQPNSTLLLALLFGSFAVAAASIRGIVRIVR